MWKKTSFSRLEKSLIIITSPLLPKSKKFANHLHKEPANEHKQFKETETLVSNSDKAIKGTVVNQALPCLHIESVSLQITLKSF